MSDLPGTDTYTSLLCSHTCQRYKVLGSLYIRLYLFTNKTTWLYIRPHLYTNQTYISVDLLKNIHDSAYLITYLTYMVIYLFTNKTKMALYLFTNKYSYHKPFNHRYLFTVKPCYHLFLFTNGTIQSSI